MVEKPQRPFPFDPANAGFDLDRALKSVVTLHATIPEDAFTASVLG